MKLYLDDDTCDHVLVALLGKAGHDVLIPVSAAMTGKRDTAHLLLAIQQDRTFLTCNYKDFVPLHELVVGCGGKHSGIMIIRKDNDPRKDLTVKGIVAAINNVVQAMSNHLSE